MKITKIVAQVKAQGRYSVFIDEKFCFGLSELGLINSGLRLGQELTSGEIESLKQQAVNDKIYNQTLSLIARRPRSRWEIEDYLKRKGHEDRETREELLSTLSKKGYLDDKDFAQRWVESRRLLRPTSKRKLIMELKQKRISEEIINQVLADDKTDEQEVLKEIIAKKSQQSRYKDKQKLIAYLARQGFSYSDIKQALGDF